MPIKTQLLDERIAGLKPRLGGRQALLFLLLLFVSSVVSAVSSSWETNPHGQVRLIAPYQTAPKDGTFYFGIHFQPAPGWMVYWKMPGDAGYAPKFNFKGSIGFKNPNVLWPRPKYFVLPGDIKEYGYDEEVVYPVKAQRTSTGAVHIAAKIDYLTCKESCVPHKYTLTLDIPAGTEPSEDADIKILLQKFVTQVPPDTEDVLASLAPEKMAAGPAQALAVIIFLGFLGGLILNVMPCVLPVLSIKLFGLLGHGGRERRIVMRDTLASAAGIVFSFLLGGALLVLAKEAGMAVGWGIQFQDPGFVAFLGIVVFLFALNLWGVFEIHLPHKLSHWGSLDESDEGPLSYFISGVFAAFLATPCSAPFLGTAMGFAISQPPPIVLAIFLSTGLGMAFPYFALAAFPKAIHWLPKPGAWMVQVKKFLGVLLMATALWLGWVFIHQVGFVKTSPAAVSGPIEWIPFNENQIETFVASGKPVFVDVTAEWCLTCKLNEKWVIQDSDIVAAFKQRGVVMMRADWTNQDTLIGTYLTKNGRAGIPFYAFYAPGRKPVLLSELLTKKQVLNALSQ